MAITSLASTIGGDVAPAYNASKSFQINYLKGLQSKVKKSILPITITNVRPGFVNIHNWAQAGDLQAKGFQAVQRVI